MSVEDVIAAVERALRAHRFRYDGERDLQAGIEQVLRVVGLPFVREASLGALGTIDFLVDARVGVEVKIAGTLAEVTRQVHRYAQHESIAALLLVTTRAPLARLPRVIAGKPVRAVHLLGGLL